MPAGAASQRIWTRATIGDRVSLEGPFGSAFLREKHSGPILGIAGGSGLAPVKAVAETALAKGMRQPIHIYFGVRSERDLYLIDRFAALTGGHSNLSFLPVLSEGPRFPGRLESLSGGPTCNGGRRGTGIAATRNTRRGHSCRRFLHPEHAA